MGGLNAKVLELRTPIVRRHHALTSPVLIMFFADGRARCVHTLVDANLNRTSERELLGRGICE